MEAEDALNDCAGPSLALHEGASLISQCSFVVHDLADQDSFFLVFILISRSMRSGRPSP